MHCNIIFLQCNIRWCSATVACRISYNISVPDSATNGLWISRGLARIFAAFLHLTNIFDATFKKNLTTFLLVSLFTRVWTRALLNKSEHATPQQTMLILHTCFRLGLGEEVMQFLHEEINKVIHWAIDPVPTPWIRHWFRFILTYSANARLRLNIFLNGTLVRWI